MIGRKVWTIAQAARLLGVSRWTVRDWVVRELLHAGRIDHPGGSYWYAIGHQDLLAFIGKHGWPSIRPLNGTGIYTILVVANEQPAYVALAHEQLSEHRWIIADNFFDAGRYYNEYTPDVVIIDGPHQSLADRLAGTPARLVLVAPGSGHFSAAHIVTPPVQVDDIVASLRQCFRESDQQKE